MSATNQSTQDLQARMALQFEVEEFLKYEASLLDARRYEDWLQVIAPDIHYWMPVRRTTTADEIESEFTAIGAVAFFDDDYNMLKMRIQRLLQERAWAEDPPSRTRHFISNILVTDQTNDTVTVSLNFHLYRTRMDSEENSWIGRREDQLRRTDSGFLLMKRHIFLEQTVILSQNMSSIF